MAPRTRNRRNPPLTRRKSIEFETVPNANTLDDALRDLLCRTDALPLLAATLQPFTNEQAQQHYIRRYTTLRPRRGGFHRANRVRHATQTHSQASIACSPSSSSSSPMRRPSTPAARARCLRYRCYRAFDVSSCPPLRAITPRTTYVVSSMKPCYDAAAPVNGHRTTAALQARARALRRAMGVRRTADEHLLNSDELGGLDIAHLKKMTETQKCHEKSKKVLKLGQVRR